MPDPHILREVADPEDFQDAEQHARGDGPHHGTLLQAVEMPFEDKVQIRTLLLSKTYQDIPRLLWLLVMTIYDDHHDGAGGDDGDGRDSDAIAAT